MQNDVPEIFSFALGQDPESLTIRIWKTEKKGLNELNISLENTSNCFWKMKHSHKKLCEIDETFKTFSNLHEIIEFIKKNKEAGTLDFKPKNMKVNLCFTAKELPKLEFCLTQKTNIIDESSLMAELINIRHELKLIRELKKIPIINYILGESVLEKKRRPIIGELVLKRTSLVFFHLFIDYQNYFYTPPFKVILQNKEKKEKTIYDHVAPKNLPTFSFNSLQNGNAFGAGLAGVNFGGAGFGSAGFGGAAFGSATFGNAAFESAAFGGMAFGGKKIAVNNNFGYNDSEEEDLDDEPDVNEANVYYEDPIEIDDNVEYKFGDNNMKSKKPMTTSVIKKTPAGCLFGPFGFGDHIIISSKNVNLIFEEKIDEGSYKVSLDISRKIASQINTLYLLAEVSMII